MLNVLCNFFKLYWLFGKKVNFSDCYVLYWYKDNVL